MLIEVPRQPDTSLTPFQFCTQDAVLQPGEFVQIWIDNVRITLSHGGRMWSVRRGEFGLSAAYGLSPLQAMECFFGPVLSHRGSVSRQASAMKGNSVQ